MNTPPLFHRLRIYAGECDLHNGRSLHESIVLAARAENMAGASVWKGLLGYGASSRLHSASILRLSEDLPVVIEIIDTPEKIEGFLPRIRTMLRGGLVTIDEVKVLLKNNPGTAESTT